MSGTSAPIALWAGFALVAAVAAALIPLAGRQSMATGITTGVGIAYLGFLLYYYLFPRPGNSNSSFMKLYVPGAVLRYVVMTGVFCTVVFLLKIHPIGVLLGTFVGMMASTFVSLNTMRQKGPKTSEGK